MNKKYFDPKWVTFVVTLIAGFLTKYFGIEVDLNKAIAAGLVIANYIFAQYQEDKKRIENGEQPGNSFGSIKWLTMALACLFLGLANYFDLPIGEGELIALVGFAGTIITTKMMKDNRKIDANNSVILKSGDTLAMGGKYDAESNFDHGPSV